MPARCGWIFESPQIPAQYFVGENLHNAAVRRQDAFTLTNGGHVRLPLVRPLCLPSASPVFVEDSGEVAHDNGQSSEVWAFCARDHIQPFSVVPLAGPAGLVRQQKRALPALVQAAQDHCKCILNGRRIQATTVWLKTIGFREN